MGTLDKLKLHAQEIMEKQRGGEVLTKEDLKVLSIYNSLSSGNNGRSGKRKQSHTGTFRKG